MVAFLLSVLFVTLIKKYKYKFQIIKSSLTEIQFNKQVNPEENLHIGDNWVSRSHHVPYQGRKTASNYFEGDVFCL